MQSSYISSTPRVTRNIIIINLIVFVATLINKGFMIENFALFYPKSPYFHWWQIVTHMFMHGNFWHIFFNMYTLVMFGTVVERYLGPKKFLLFYFVCGLGAAALHMGVQFLQMQSFMDSVALGHPGAMQNITAIRMTPTVGASGAIYGLLIGYLLILMWRKRGVLFDKNVL